MKILILMILLPFSWVEQTFSQERINCTLFIDGRIPSRGSVYDCQLITPSEAISFTYIVGEFWVDSTGVKKLELLDDECSIEIKFSYINNDNERYEYYGVILKRWFFYEYLVLTITNLDKEKNEFHFSFSTPAESKIPIRGEYRPMW